MILLIRHLVVPLAGWRLNMGEYYIELKWSSDVLEECKQVLDHADRNHDANEGINWTVLEVTADILFPLGG